MLLRKVSARLVFETTSMGQFRISSIMECFIIREQVQRKVIKSGTKSEALNYQEEIMVNHRFLSLLQPAWRHDSRRDFQSSAQQIQTSWIFDASLHVRRYLRSYCHSLAKRDTDRLQSTSVPNWTHIREESRFCHWSRVDHEGSYHQTLPVVLLPASPNTHGSALAHIISHPNFGPCLHLHASRFRQQPSLRDKCLPLRPSPIGPQLCCTFDPQNWQIRSDLGCNSTWPSLASVSVSYSIQTKLHNEQLPGWPCTGVLDRALPLREWHPSKAQPSVIVSGSTPGSSVSEGAIRSKRFLRLRTTAVEFTSFRHPTSPQWTSTFQEET